MLLGFVMAYWVVSILIGLYAARRVHSASDFAIAGRHLPFHIVTATVFATWFGAETVLGIPATFLENGLHGVVSDPFGASLCLILVGLFFAVPLYRMKLLTIGDFYKKRFGRSVEMLTSLAIILSYLGWVAAQISALGLVFHVVSGEMISREMGMWIGSITILIYTFFGGMWAVAITDFIQMIVIVLGMLWIGGSISELTGGVGVVVNHAYEAGKFSFWPQLDLKEIIAFVAAWCTMMLGSIPQQDVFQRVQSAKSEKVAKWASVLGGSLYFFFAFVPIFLAYSATLIDPALVQQWQQTDSQMILPKLVLAHAPLLAQILFFGALLSAIKSTASATLLAPSVSFAENIVKPLLGHRMTDQQLLKTMRVVTVIFTILVTIYAKYSDNSIFEFVESAYQVTLVAAFVPLTFGLFWKKATTQGALASIFLGVSIWIICMVIESSTQSQLLIPPQFSGLLASLLGMLIGSITPQYIKHDPMSHLPVPQTPEQHEQAAHSH
jgi:SSS family solute:Na+ symporter